MDRELTHTQMRGIEKETLLPLPRFENNLKSNPRLPHFFRIGKLPKIGPKIISISFLYLFCPSHSLCRLRLPPFHHKFVTALVS